MSASQELNIYFRLKDEFSSVSKNVAKNLDSMTTGLRTISREIRKVSTNMVFMGAAITGPFALSLRTASEYNYEVKRSTDALNDSMKSLQIEVAQDILPVFRDMVNNVAEGVRWFKSFDDETRKTILQMTLITGVALTLTGVFGRTLSAAIDLTRGMLLLVKVNPLLFTMAAAVLAGVIFWDKLRSIVKPFLSVMESAVEGILGVILELNAEFMGLISTIIRGWGYLFDLAAKLPGPFKNAFKSVGKDLDELQKQWALWGQQQRSMSQGLFGDAWTKFKTGASDISDVLDKVNGKLDLFRSKWGLSDLSGSYSRGSFTEGFTIGLSDAMRAMQDFNAMGKKLAQDLAGNMTTVFKNSFFHVMKGEFDKLSEDFQNFADSVLMSIAEIMAQMAAMQVIQSALGVFGKAWNPATASIVDKMHSGGPIRMHSGGEVPILAKAGEYMVSERGVKSVGTDTLDRINRGGGIGDNVTIAPTIVIQAWDASDIVRNRSTIEAIFIDSLQRNRSIRSAIKRNV
jgi:hypothetical protein